MDYQLLVAWTVVEFLESLPVRDRHRLRACLKRITQDPDGKSDYQERDDAGRPVEIHVCAGHAFKYWTDHTDRQIKVLRCLFRGSAEELTKPVQATARERSCSISRTSGAPRLTFVVMRSEHHGRSPRSTVDGADHADGRRNGGGFYPRHQRNPRSTSGWELCVAVTAVLEYRIASVLQTTAVLFRVFRVFRGGGAAGLVMAQDQPRMNANSRESNREERRTGPLIRVYSRPLAVFHLSRGAGDARLGLGVTT